MGKQATENLHTLRARGVKTALGSASKNAPLSLDRLGITPLFDVIIDGNKVSQAKPHPEVFLRATSELGIEPASCVVFEDAEAGVEAAHRAGMGIVGVGNPSTLTEADVVIQGLWQLLQQKSLCSSNQQQRANNGWRRNLRH